MTLRSTPHRLAALLVAALLLLPLRASGQGPSVFAFNTFTTAVTLTTTTENIIVSSAQINTPRDEAVVFVLCFGQLTTGTMTTGVIPRIRRGTSVSGTLVSEENTITVGAAAGSTEQFFITATEQRAATNIQYSCTLDQVAADGDGAAIYGGILVLAR